MILKFYILLLCLFQTTWNDFQNGWCFIFNAYNIKFWNYRMKFCNLSVYTYICGFISILSWDTWLGTIFSFHINLYMIEYLFQNYWPNRFLRFYFIIDQSYWNTKRILIIDNRTRSSNKKFILRYCLIVYCKHACQC